MQRTGAMPDSVKRRIVSEKELPNLIGETLLVDLLGLSRTYIYYLLRQERFKTIKQANYLLRSGESLFPGHRSVFCILCQDLFQVLPPGFLFNNKSKGGEVMIKVFHDTFIMFIYRMSISAGIPMIENMRFQWGWISSYVDWI